MKTLTVKTIQLLALSFLASATAARAVDYALTLPGASVNWNAASWAPAGGPTSASDTLTLSASAQTDFYLGEDRTVGLFTFTGGTVRIRAGNIASSADNRFSITTLNIDGGSFTFADRGAGDSALDVSIGNLNVSGNFFLGRVGVAPAKFAVSGTTTIDGGRVALQAMTPDAHLGHVVFGESGKATLNLGNNSGSYFTAPYTLKVASLEGGSANNSGITSDTPQAARPTLRIESVAAHVADFKGVIEDGTTKVRLEVAGAGVQSLSRAAGHTYSGGTEISGGTLVVNNTSGSGLGTGGVTISGGTLAGTGLIALGEGQTVSVASGGVIAPGLPGGGPDSLRLSGAANGDAPILSLGAGAALAFTLGAANASSRIELSHFAAGDLELNATAVHITDAAEGLYVLFSFTDGSGNAVASGLSTGLVAGSGLEGFSTTFYYDDLAHGGVGTVSMQLEAIPEPGTVSLAVAVLGTFGAICFAKRLPHATR